MYPYHRLQRRRPGKRKDWQGKEEKKNVGSEGRKNMRVEAEEVIQPTGTGIAIGIKIGTDTVNETVGERGLARGMVEEAGIGKEEGTGGKAITGMEEMKAEKDTVSGTHGWKVMGTYCIPLFGVVIGGCPETQFAHLSGLRSNLKMEEVAVLVF